MFEKSLGTKKTYTYNGYTLYDLTESIFDPTQSMSSFGTPYKVPEEFEMRPDLVSEAIYGTTDYTEMVLKYSLIQNPFALEKDDFIFGIALSSIYNPVKDMESDTEETSTYDALKTLHKYVDQSKLPKTVGSEKNTISIPSSSDETVSGSEPNISATGDTGIKIENGRIYFGESSTPSTAEKTNNNCVTSGMTLGEFLNATVSTYTKK